MKRKKISVSLLVLIVILILLINVSIIFATPVGPSITYRGNSTMTDSGAQVYNGTGNTTKSGGYIFSIDLTSNQKNTRWKAYVGNVTGTLVLRDSDGFSIYDWSLGATQTGEVYASRANNVNWGNINCSFMNATIWEMRKLNHTNNPNDNISRTFNNTDNSQFDVGTKRITANSCNTTNLYVNGAVPDDDSFEEVLLYDGSRTGLNLSENAAGFGNIVYTSIIEQDAQGYDYDGTSSNSTYDFQMIVPEVGLSSWTSSTAYYFYIELG